MTDETAMPAGFEPDPDPDPVKELAKSGRIVGAMLELTPEAILAKLKAATPGPVMATSVTADEVMRAIAAPFLGQPNPETIECVGDKLTMTGTLSIRYTLTREDGRWSMEDRDELGLSGSADDDATPAQHVRAFLEEFLFVWDGFALAPDAKLARTAQELKRKLLGLFGLEAEEDGR